MSSEDNTSAKESPEDRIEEVEVEEEETTADAAGEQQEEEKKKPAAGKKSTAIVISKEPKKTATKKTAPANEDEKPKRKRKPAAKKKKEETPTEIVCPTRLHSIIHKIIQKKRPGMNVGSDFVDALSKALNHHVVSFIKVSHICSEFKGLKTTNGNALIATGEIISELRRNPHLMLKIKPPSQLVLGASVKKADLLLTYK